MPFESLGAVSCSSSIATMAISEAVRKIFSMKEWCDLENRVRVRSMSLKIIAYEFLFTFHSNYGAIVYHLRDIVSYWSKIVKFLYPTGRPRRNFVKMFDAGKTRMIGLPYGKTRSPAGAGIANRPLVHE